MIFRTALFAMRTRFELVLEARDEWRARAAGEAALAIIEECDASWSRFRSDSLVSRINREAGVAGVRIDSETFELLEHCARLQRDTLGAFDVCVGVPMDRVRAGLGLGEPGRAGLFELDATTSSVRFTREASALDLGAIGKGHALDLAAASLAEAGIESALLHAGTSSVIALGAPSKLPEGWPVALGPEFDDARVYLNHGALSVSDARGARRSDPGAPRESHVLDPRSGQLLHLHARAAVTCRTAAEADAWSTALLVLAAREGGIEGEIPGCVVPEDLACTVRAPGASSYSRASLTSGASLDRSARNTAGRGGWRACSDFAHEIRHNPTPR